MPLSRRKSASAEPLPTIGWRERVSLPQLGLGTITAKIDTGASSAALHATDIMLVGAHVEFTVPVNDRQHRCRLPFKGSRRIKSSTGHSQHRALVETEVKIGPHRYLIDVTLTDRTDMGVPMLIGRRSIAGRFLVDPAHSYILSATKRKTP